MKDNVMLKNYDPEILKRLMSFLKPYSRYLVIAVISLVITTISELLMPVIIQKTIDNHIIVNFLRIHESNIEDEELTEFKNPVYVDSFYYIKEENSIVFNQKIKNLEFEKERFYISESGGTEPGYNVYKSSELKTLNKEELTEIRKKDLFNLSKMIKIFLLLLVFVLIFSFTQIYIMTHTGQLVMKDIRLKMLKHTLKQPLDFFNSNPVGGIVSRISNDVETINELFTTVATELLKDICLMIGVIITLFLLNFYLALITLTSLVPILVITLYFKKKSREAYRKVRIWISKFNAFLSEHISGMHIVQIFGREKISKKEFEVSNKGLLKANLMEMYVYAIFRPLVNLFTSISIAVVIYFGAGILVKGIVSLGILIAFLNLIDKFYQPVQDMSEKFTILQSAMAGCERVFNLLDNNSSLENQIENENKRIKLNGEIEFRNVNFSYKEDHPVIRNLSFKIKPGETVAVVGYTGAGKTTIANLMTRLWEINSGEIIIDGKNIKDYSLYSLRKAIIPVQQDVFLFSGSIYDNIALGRNLNSETVEESAKTVLAHNFIKKMPEKYNTKLNEGANNISAGQRQLLSFARALAHNPDIIILDEATASIDTESEKIIQKALEQLLKNRTALVIAHRLSTIKNADRILVLSNGKLVEQGNHEKLLKEKGVYYNLYKLQYEQQPL